MVPMIEQKPVGLQQRRVGNEEFYCGHVDFDKSINIWVKMFTNPSEVWVQKLAENERGMDFLKFKIMRLDIWRKKRSKLPKIHSP